MEHTINAKGKIVGRLASEIAMILMGKNKPSYRPNVIPNVKIKIYNTDLIKISGRKSTQKMYYRHSGYIGNLKTEPYEKLLARDSRQIVTHAVLGMLPKNKLRKQQLKNIVLYKGPVPTK